MRQTNQGHQSASVFIENYCRFFCDVLEADQEIQKDDIEKQVKKLGKCPDADSAKLAGSLLFHCEELMHRACNNYVNNRVENGIFEIGSGMEFLDNLNGFCSNFYVHIFGLPFPKALESAIELMKLRLYAMDLSGNFMTTSGLASDITQLKSNVEQSTKGMEQLKLTYSALNNDIDKARKKLKRVQKEYVAILGIFASIVLTFTAGLSFSSSLLSNIHQVSAYRIVLVSLIIGFVITNLVYSLFSAIRGIINDDIPSNSEQIGSPKKKKKFPKASQFLSENKTQVFISAVFVFLIGLVLLMWWFKLIECRNGIA